VGRPFQRLLSYDNCALGSVAFLEYGLEGDRMSLDVENGKGICTDGGTYTGLEEDHCVGVLELGMNR